MSFFKDFKEDLSQAVNELMPEEAAAGTPEDIQMVDTLTVDTLTDDEDDNEPSIEEMLNNIENINIEKDEAAESYQPAFDSVPEPAAEPEEYVPEPVSEPVIEEIPEVQEETVEEIEIKEEIPVIPAEEPVIEQEVAQVMEEEKAVLEDEDRASDETGLITAGMVIKGDITTTGSLEIVGSIEGDVDVKGKLEITGSIKGNSKAADVYADTAKIVGEIVSTGPVKIGQSSVVKGNITAKSAVLAGAVKGDIDVQGPVILDTTAIIMGNIKSKSIQINNGAVIEGMCSQCYAEVSPTNFFEEDVKAASKAKK
ncbi:MAG: polymer-forming cytoskeletal protein [bacterium]|nr:polymer-forming cytoskeletal protein [bacterium]